MPSRNKPVLSSVHRMACSDVPEGPVRLNTDYRSGPAIAIKPSYPSVFGHCQKHNQSI